MLSCHKKYLGFWKFIQNFVIAHNAKKNKISTKILIVKNL
jgi:hypothetical protein